MAVSLVVDGSHISQPLEESYHILLGGPISEQFYHQVDASQRCIAIPKAVKRGPNLLLCLTWKWLSLDYVCGHLDLTTLQTKAKLMTTMTLVTTCSFQIPAELDIVGCPIIAVFDVPLLACTSDTSPHHRLHLKFHP